LTWRFRAGLCGFPFDNVPSSPRSTGSSFYEHSLQFRVRLAVVRPGTAVTGTSFLGVSSFFATSVEAIHSPVDSHADFCFALSVSHALDDLLQLLPCRFISLCSHVQGLHFKGFPCRPASQALHFAVPSCRFACRSFGRRSSLPVRQAPPSGLSSSRQSVVTKRLLHRFRNSLPSCAFYSFGVLPAAVATAFTVAATHDLFTSAPPRRN